jgi:hypothetical protein
MVSPSVDLSQGQHGSFWGDCMKEKLFGLVPSLELDCSIAYG